MSAGSPGPALQAADKHDLDSTNFDGLVIAHLGKSLAVETADGQTMVCHRRRHITDVAVGDRVRWEGCDGGLGLVLEVLPRRTALVRPAHGGKLRTVASNIDRVWIVIAPEPEPDYLLVDQILAVCAHRGIDAGLLLNKTDLLPRSGAIERALDAYRAAGYRVLAASVRMASGLVELRAALGDFSSILAGQSGVGKSSLTNALLPDKSLRVNELSRKSRLGRHTTTSATLYHLPNGGELIDSPGVTVFGLAGMSRRDIAEGFIEFREFLDGCRFTDCSHQQDKGCAVRQAVDQGRISGERYGRYCRLLGKTLSTAFFSGSGEN